MSRRITKQFFYGFFYLIILALIGWGLYGALLKPAPTCSDFVRNGGEEGVDCGGVCGNICLPPDTKNIETVGPVAIMRPAEGGIVVLGKVQNSNAEVAVDAFDYRFDLYSGTDEILKSITGHAYLYADEVRYITEFVPDQSARSAARAELTLSNPTWRPAGEFPRPLLAIQDSAVTAASGTIVIVGRVINNDTIALPHVTVLAVLRGKLGAPEGASMTELDAIASGKAREFTITYPWTDSNPPKVELVPFARRP